MSEYYFRGGNTPTSSSYILFRKIAVLGDRHCGKSSLAERFVSGRFVENYDPTIENTLRKQIGFRSKSYNVEIVDTAGNDEYSRLSRNATIGVHGYILVYSIVSRSSLEKIRQINKMLLNMIGNPPAVPRIIVGTMSDVAEQR
jgi:Ras homolog enriched in brain